MAGGIALVQGASRGIGFHFCKLLVLSRPKVSVIGTCRNPEAALALQELREQYPKALTIMKMDVTSTSDIQNTAEKVKQDFGSLDLLINSSAMLHPSGKGETSLREVTAEGLSHAIATNTIGPLMMAKYFAPLLMRGSGAFGADCSNKEKTHSAVFVNMSAKVGSIGDNALGGWYSYRMSKAALNMTTKNLSIELGRGKNKVICVSLHPGTVDTDLSRPYHKNVPKEKLFTAEQSVNYLMHIIENLSIDKTGKFFSWNGTELPW
ncbi:C-factor-like [Spea bombifrons]|uniref:C-factor-like n=1 Tax=Spea bombifrons TaxID=233779 RepID=UPI00234A2B26|nr:C-factor-like [Spea bombifrons]